MEDTGSARLEMCTQARFPSAKRGRALSLARQVLPNLNALCDSRSFPKWIDISSLGKGQNRQERRSHVGSFRRRARHARIAR